MSKLYKYELHCHTSVSSSCSKFNPAEIINLYKNLGYDGVFITDHYYQRNNLSLTDNAILGVKGYNEVKRLAENVGLKVFYGVEYSATYNHFLIYGLSPEWHVENAEKLKDLEILEALAFYRENGATIIHAHPFRPIGENPTFELMPKAVDGVEILNGGRPPYLSNIAKHYAKEYDLPVTAGSDIHRYTAPVLCQFITSTPINDENDYIKILKSKKYKIKQIKNPYATK